jgi:hypothetical protein
MEAGKVWLTPNCFDVMNQLQAVELKKEMVDWSIKLESYDSPDCYRNMFQAALVLAKAGFTVYISMGINHEKEIMYPPVSGDGRFSGVICLMDEILVSFYEPERSEDGVRSFSSIMEWAERYEKSEVKNWTVDQWKDFLIKKIMTKSLQELDEAAKRSELANKNLAEKHKKNGYVVNALKDAADQQF